jgi:GNAT superfamily N-acetyltransferase
MSRDTAIRPARQDDVPAIERIVRDAYERYIERIGKPPGPMLDDYPARVAEGTAWVLDEGGGIAGVLVLLPAPDHLLLDNVAVDPAHHGRGLGRRLMTFAEDEARRLGFTELRLYTHVTMYENLAMYPRLGYEEYARFEQGGYQRVFMRKRIG